MNYDDILKHIQRKLGNEPRTFSLWDKLTWLQQDLPEWDWKDEGIRHTVNNWQKVFTHGKITWGHIIQVNKLMFEKSKVNCPGEVLIWYNNTTPLDFDSFELAAHELYELKGYSEHLDDPKEKIIAEYLEDQFTRVYGLKVPDRISNGLNLRISTVFFQRRHIPNGIIASSLFPILYLDESPMVAAMVPYKFWPVEFFKSWS